MSAEDMPTTERSFILWHLPRSTPLLTSSDRSALAALVDRLLADAVPPGHLLLQSASADECLGHQWTGAQLRAVLLSAPDESPALGTSSQ
jgi:hypothetical protein